MTDEMVAVAQLRRHVVGLVFEVDALERRSRRIAAAGQEDALEPPLERALLRPGRLGVADAAVHEDDPSRSEEHTSELQSRPHLVCRLLLEKKKKNNRHRIPKRAEQTQSE